jgi:hypothetical protein
VEAAVVSLRQTQEDAMRRRNLAIAIVTGLGMLGAAFALTVMPLADGAKAQEGPPPEAVVFLEVTEVQALGNVHGDATNASAQSAVLTIKGTLAEASPGAPNDEVRLRGRFENDNSRWVMNKCAQYAQKLLAKPGKYEMVVECYYGFDGSGQCFDFFSAGHVVTCSLRRAGAPTN